MRKLSLLSVVISSLTGLCAQESTLEKSILGLQVGLPSSVFYYEPRLSKSISLRAEMGVRVGAQWGVVGDTYYSDVQIVPVFNIEPRWYYNLSRRASKLKPTENNSADYLSIKSTLQPNWYFQQNPYFDVPTEVQYGLSWGHRRTLCGRIEYEVGAEYMFRKDFSPTYTGLHERWRGELGLFARVGYRLCKR